MGGIGIICEHGINIGKILAIQLTLDNIPYEIKGEVVYCIRNDDKFRAGLKIVQRDKRFIRHLKIFVARISLNSIYGKSADQGNVDFKTPTISSELEKQRNTKQ
jgi:hypothetical protein